MISFLKKTLAILFLFFVFAPLKLIVIILTVLEILNDFLDKIIILWLEKMFLWAEKK